MNVVAAPLRSEKTKALRHNTKQGTSPLDALNAMHTNRFQIYRGTKWKIEKSIKIARENVR